MHSSAHDITALRFFIIIQLQCVQKTLKIGFHLLWLPFFIFFTSFQRLMHYIVKLDKGKGLVRWTMEL